MHQRSCPRSCECSCVFTNGREVLLDHDLLSTEDKLSQGVPLSLWRPHSLFPSRLVDQYAICVWTRHRRSRQDQKLNFDVQEQENRNWTVCMETACGLNLVSGFFQKWDLYVKGPFQEMAKKVKKDRKKTSRRSRRDAISWAARKVNERPKEMELGWLRAKKAGLLWGPLLRWWRCCAAAARICQWRREEKHSHDDNWPADDENSLWAATPDLLLVPEVMRSQHLYRRHRALEMTNRDSAVAENLKTSLRMCVRYRKLSRASWQVQSANTCLPCRSRRADHYWSTSATTYHQSYWKRTACKCFVI